MEASGNQDFDKSQRPSKVVVYTAIFGDKDAAPKLLNKAELNLPNCKFLCITDNPKLTSKDYQVVVVERKFSDVTKNARDIKVNGFEGIEEFDIAIWHDSSVQIHCNQLQQLSSFAKDHMISTFHHVRYCAYLEANACIDHNKDSALRILLQMFRYFREGFPANHKLHETTILVLNCSSYLTSELRTIWWNEIRKRSRRDQLSLAYARWKTGIEPGLLAEWNINRTNNNYSTWIGHEHDRYDHNNFFLRFNSRLIKGICKRLIYAMRRNR